MLCNGCQKEFILLFKVMLRIWVNIVSIFINIRSFKIITYTFECIWLFLNPFENINIFMNFIFSEQKSVLNICLKIFVCPNLNQFPFTDLWDLFKNKFLEFSWCFLWNLLNIFYFFKLLDNIMNNKMFNLFVVGNGMCLFLFGCS